MNFSSTQQCTEKQVSISTFTNRGESLVLLTFASSLQKAFRKAKSAYKETPYPKVGIGHFTVHGTLQSIACSCDGDWVYKCFHLDWANPR
ncbi:MAG: hypothetical protein ACLPN2_17805 [Terriglobales bacterium]